MDLELENIKLMFGDALERMREIPDESIDMILTDPPYGTMSTIAQTDGVIHGMKGRTNWDKTLDTKQMMNECFRVLKHRGTLALFSQDPYTTEIISGAHGNMPFSYRYIWVKDHFGNGLIAKRAPVNFFEDICVYFKRAEDMRGHPLQSWFNEKLALTGCSVEDVISLLGNGGIRHHFTTGKVFRVPNQERYTLMQQFFNVFDLPYEELKRIDTDFKSQIAADRIKVFNLPEGEQCKGNILDYPKDRNTKHPTQKPVALCEDLILTYTNPGATVLDFTMGSGTTGVAALNTGRKFIGIELSPEWFAESIDRLLTHESFNNTLT